ncbi:hypothetical protein WJX81_003385 [Elliptochloris bilobata]|uniref:Kinesin motor domain-containing protein n=1 Tax=Elliptochloris bilobata TaxID=381761 RepID=A0AAW1SHM7_9CHLO
MALCAPGVPTHFVVSSTSGARLKATDVRVSIKGGAAAGAEVRERREGTVEVTYTAPMSGEYRITLGVGPTQIGTYRAQCAPPRPSEALSRVRLAAASSAFVGERYSAVAEVVDQFGGRFAGEPKLTANLTDDTGAALFAAEVRALREDGLHEVAFTPRISGQYRLEVTLDGRPLAGSPFPLHVRCDETAAAVCKLFGVGLTHAVAGERTSFGIQAVDCKGNARLQGGDQFRVDISGPALPAPAATLDDNLDGTYKISWETEVAGDYQINVTLDGSVVGGSAVQCAVAAGPLAPMRCTCEGPGLTAARAGEPAAFTIAAADAFGNRRGAADEFVVSVACLDAGGAAPVAAHVEHLGRGAYRATYTVTMAGSHSVFVMAAGRQLAGSPFRAEAAPGDVAAPACRLFGPGLAAVALGRDTRLFLELADAFGNAVAPPARPEAASIQVVVEGPACPLVRAGPPEGGAAAYAYNTSTPGAYTISATVRGAHVRGSPATIVASIAEPHAPLCAVKGAPRELSVAAGETAELILVAKDAAGICKSLGGDNFTVSWQRAGDAEPATAGLVEDLGTGEYRAAFRATAAGVYVVAVQLGGRNIAGSPFAAAVTPASVCATTSTVALALNALIAGQQGTFLVRALDRFANPVSLAARVATGPRTFQATLAAAGSDPQPLALHLSGSPGAAASAKLEAHFLALCAGVATLAVTYAGTHVRGSPWQVPVAPGRGCARTSAVHGLPAHLVAGTPASVRAVLADEHGNLLAGGGDAVVVSVNNPLEGAAAVPIEDCGDGSYVATICLRRAGLATVAASVNGDPAGPAITLPVQPGGLHALALLSRGQLLTTAGEHAVVAVGALDAFGNALACGGAALEATLRVVAAGAGPGEPAAVEAQPAEVADRGDGTYEVTCSLQQACNFEVCVAIAGRPDSRVTCSGACRPATTCPARCRVEASPAPLAAGFEGILRAWRADCFGNRISEVSGEAPMVAAGEGPGDVATDVSENGDGSFTVRYSARTAGRYALTVACSTTGEPLAGSPFTLNVAPGPAAASRSVATLAVLVDGEPRVPEPLVPTLSAGAEVTVAVSAADEHGNPLAGLEGQAIIVEAQGPQQRGMPFRARAEAPGMFTAALTAAGAYLLYARLEGALLAGWPRVLHVAAGPSNATKCTLAGEGFGAGPLLVGKVVSLALHTVDCYGNARAAGGEDVTVALEGPAGSEVTSAAVACNSNGTYAVRWAPDRAGRWLLHPRVNGCAVREGGYEVQAAFGAFRALECAVEAVDALAAVAVGSVTELMVVPLVAKEMGRAYSGTEVVQAHVTGPSGATRIVTACLLDGGRAWRVKLGWAEAGAHRVAVSLGGAHVGGSPFVVQAEPAVVCLAASTFEGAGLRECMAGRQAAFAIQARDRHGHAVRRGSAGFLVEVTAGAERVQGAVADNGDGRFEVAYTVTAAGPVVISASLAGQPAARAFKACCKAAGAALGRCTVAAFSELLVAGEPGVLVFWQADRFGNESRSSLAEMRLSVEAEGPWPLDVTWEHAHDGSISLTYSACKAGEYRLSVVNAKTKERLPGSPFAVAMRAAAADAGRSSAAFIDGAKPAKGAAPGAAAAAMAAAGAPVTLTATLRDRYGNLAPDDEGEVRVSAKGPAEVDFERTGSAEQGALFTISGSYLVRVTLGGKLLAGWPQLLSVVPAPDGEASCRLRGDALHGIVAFRRESLTLQVMDRFQNRRLSGGDRVAAELTGPDKSRITASVADRGSGAYTLVFTVNLAGSWSLLPFVNGEPVEAARCELRAEWGPLTAADCELLWEHGAAVAAGAVHEVALVPCQLHLGRRPSGREAVAFVLVAPSGVARALHAELDEHSGACCFRAQVVLAEVGAHKLHALLGDEPVPGGPLKIECTPGPLTLHCCRLVDEAALADGVVAGEQATAVLAAADAHGHALTAGGDALATIITCVDGSTCAADVDDRGDGTYALRFTLTAAGPFQLALATPSNPGGTAAGAAGPVFHGVCRPARAAAQACTIEAAEAAVTAGATGRLRIARADSYGNAIASGAGQPAMLATWEGPGPVECTVLELRGGCAEVSFSAKAAGEYAVALRCREQEPLVGGAPLAVRVGGSAVVTMGLRDAHGNATVEVGGRALALEASGPAALTFEASGEGSTSYAAAAAVAGEYVLAVRLGGAMLHGWPRILHALPGACDAGRCWLSGAALAAGAIVGAPAALTLHTADAAGNVRAVGSARVSATLRGGPARAVPTSVEAAVVDNCDGTYSFTFTLPLMGFWEVAATVDGAPVPPPAGGPVTARYGRLAAADCEVVGLDAGEGAACGSTDPIFIQAAAGRRMGGGEAVAVQVRAPSGATAAVPVALADGGGHFRAVLHWAQLGLHRVAVLLDGAPVPGTPLGVCVGPAPLHPPACLLRGLDEPGNGGLGMLTFHVHGRDAFGNVAKLGPRAVEVSTEPEGALRDVAMSQWEDKTVVTVRSTVLTPGTMRVLVAGKPVCAAGFALAASAGAHCALAFLSGDLRVAAGEQAAALLEVRDNARRRLPRGGAKLEAVLVLAASAAPEPHAPKFVAAAADAHPAAAPAVEVVDRGNGLYELRFTPMRSGAYALRARLAAGGDGAQCAVACKPGAADPGGFVAAWAPGPWAASEPGVLTVTRKDRYGNPLTDAAGAPALRAALAGAGPAAAAVEEAGEGRVRVTCRAHVAGAYALAVRCAASGAQVAGSPFQVTLHPAAVSLEACSYSLAGLRARGASASPNPDAAAAPRVRAGDAVLLAVNTRDRFSNAVTVAPGTLVAAANGPKGAVPFAPQEGGEADVGVHRLRAVPTAAGRHALSISLADADGRAFAAVPACGAPVALTVVPGPVYGRRTAVRDLPRLVTAGVAAEFAVIPMDAYGNPGASGGAFAAELAPVGGNGGASMACRVDETAPGGVRTLMGAVAGVPAGFAIQACDAFGNARRSGGDSFQATMRGADPVTGPDGRHVRGSPVALTVFRDVGALADREMQRRLLETVAGLKREVADARTQHTTLRQQAIALGRMIPVLAEGARSGINQVLQQQDTALAEARAAFAREACARRRLHNTVQELRGNIRVFVRVRPDADAAGSGRLPAEDGHRVLATTAGATKAFDFDRAFPPEASQTEVFEDVSPLVTSALDGYNVCIFAYGQTGVGKTHTMLGTAEDPGINFRTMCELFRSIKEERPAEMRYEITAAILELYNEAVYDLLAPGGKAELELARSAGGFDLPDLTRVSVKSAEQIQAIMARGFEQRAVGCHDVNAHSSRSHCLLVVHVAATDPTTGVRAMGKLTLCDLAGSERITKTGATGLTLTEAQNINRSLLELGNVMSALMQNASHVPYRNSKLTMLLQDSLGGEAKALMVACVSPAALHAAETLSTLAFASKVANVVLKTPQRKFEEGPASAASAGAAGAAHASARRPGIHVPARTGRGAGAATAHGAARPPPFA